MRKIGSMYIFLLFNFCVISRLDVQQFFATLFAITKM